MKRTLALSMLCAAAAVAVSLALGTSAPAGTVTLTASDAGGTTSFNAAGHWDNFAPPSAGNDYVDNQYQLRTPQAAGDFTFAGDSLTMGDGVNSAQLLWKGTTANASITINDLRLNNGSVANGVGGNFTLAGNITLQAGGGSFDYAGNGRSMTVTAPIGGAGDATVINTGTAGNGTIIFAAANSYSGATNVNAGTLRLTDSGALGNTTGVVINTNTGQVSGTGPMLELQNNVSIPAAVSLTMNSVAAGNYRTEFRTNGGNNTWNGPVYLNGDGLTQVAADGAGTLTINGNISAGGSGFTGTLFLRGGGATGTINGTINMPGGTLAKTDDSTWTVGAAGMTYSWGNTLSLIHI